MTKFTKDQVLEHLVKMSKFKPYADEDGIYMLEKKGVLDWTIKVTTDRDIEIVGGKGKAAIAFIFASLDRDTIELAMDGGITVNRVHFNFE